MFLQHKIGYPNWYTFSCQRVYRIGTGEDTGYDVVFTYVPGTGRFLVRCYGLPVCSICDTIDKWMLRCQGDKGHAKDGIRPRCVHLHALFRHPINRHLELQALGASNPITLVCLHSFRPVELIQIIQKSLSIAGYFQEPLLKPSPLHNGTAALTAPI